MYVLAIILAVLVFRLVFGSRETTAETDPDDCLFGKPNWQDEPGKPAYSGTVISDHAYRGEPPNTKANQRSFFMKSALIAGVGVMAGSLSDATYTTVISLIDQHQYLAFAGGVICIFLAVLVGAVRQVFHKMMSRALAVPMQDESGNLFLCYLGDVPSPSWQYSPWPRLLTWVFVAATSLIGAFIGGQLASIWIGAEPAVAFYVLLIVRWAVSSIPALFWSPENTDGAAFADLDESKGTFHD